MLFRRAVLRGLEYAAANNTTWVQAGVSSHAACTHHLLGWHRARTAQAAGRAAAGSTQAENTGEVRHK